MKLAQDIITASTTFHSKIKRFTEHNLIQNISNHDHLQDALSTRILLHRDVYTAIEAFLKLPHTKIPSQIYKNMTLESFLHRLLVKRPLMFCGSADYTILRDGSTLKNPSDWYLVGTEHEQAPLLMKDYLTYKEMLFSALLSVSSFARFINQGHRTNRAIPSTAPFIQHGVYIGCVGPRFEKQDQMDSLFILKGAKNDSFSTWTSAELGLFQSLYQIKPDNTLVNLSDCQFNVNAYKRRLQLTLEPVLCNAESRAKEVEKKAYVHLVGLGLGVWKIYVDQYKFFIDTLVESLQKLELKHIRAVDLSYIERPFEFTIESVDGIDLIFSKRDPAEVLRTPYDDCLLVATYAWDGNSLPGNEIYGGSLSGSGDPAAACCSTIYELQNPHINPYTSNISIY